MNVGQNPIWESPSEKLSNMSTFPKLRMLTKSFFESQFSYCPLVWMFCSRTLNNRINKLHERVLRILYRDDISTFKQLLNEDKSVTEHDRNIQLLAIEMYKVKNNISPCSLSDFVSIKELNYEMRQISDFECNKPNTVYNGTATIRILGPEIWDLIPNKIKESSSVSSFKIEIKNWTTEECPCSLCKTFIHNLFFLYNFVYNICIYLLTFNFLFRFWYIVF